MSKSTASEVPKEIGLLKKAKIDHIVLPYNFLPKNLRSNIDVVLEKRTNRTNATNVSWSTPLTYFSFSNIARRNAPSKKQAFVELLVIPFLTAISGYVATSHAVGRATVRTAQETSLSQVHHFLRADPTSLYMAIHKEGHLILAKKPPEGLRRLFFKFNIPRKWVKVY
ncbi:MAG: hypothetical protein ABH863_02900 [Candidatus Micrarchaeota archaeon]